MVLYHPLAWDQIVLLQLMSPGTDTKEGLGHATFIEQEIISCKIVLSPDLAVPGRALDRVVVEPNIEGRLQHLSTQKMYWTAAFSGPA